MKISIKIKITTVMTLIGIIMLLFCWSNVSALNKIVNFTNDIGKTYDATVETFDEESIASIADKQETMSYLMSQTKARVSGTLVFDVNLVGPRVVAIVMTITRLPSSA